MIPSGNDVRVYLATGVTDMRKSINTLSILSGHLFGFCNRKRDTLKILYWDRNGFCLWHKRLERDRFRWPQNDVEVQMIGSRELRWLLDGLSIQQPAHGALGYSIVC